LAKIVYYTLNFFIEVNLYIERYRINFWAKNSRIKKIYNWFEIFCNAL